MNTDKAKLIKSLKMKKKANKEENIWLFFLKPALILIAIFVVLILINNVGF